MSYEIIPTKFFLDQIKDYDRKTKKIIFSKKELITVNPFRYKSVETPHYRHVFSVKFSEQKEAKRLIYLVLRNKVFLCFVLDRSKGYKDLDEYFKKIGKLD